MLANMKARRPDGGPHDQPFPAPETIGWSPSCSCNAGEAVPSVVLDPFAGSGTTLAVAATLGRFGLGVELNAEYVKLIHERVAKATGRMPGSLLAQAA
jgi:site-specific DNA-methyltransferase (adenine-specific)